MSSGDTEDDDANSVSSWSSSGSNSSRGSTRSSKQRSSTAQAQSGQQQQQQQPAKYKRRRRVYDRIKANVRYQSLATVPEGEELRDSHPWLGPKIAGILMLVLICIGGIKEGYHTIRNDTTRYNGSSSSESESVRRRKKGLKKSSRAEESEDDEDDLKAYKEAVIPTELANLAGVYDPILPNDRTFLWHIPRSAGSTIKMIASQCFGLLLATELGASKASNQISIITDLEGGNYVNIDASTKDGILHAKEVNIGMLPGLNFVASSYFYDAAQHLFSPTHRGRCITMMRHPVERSVSLYHIFQEDANNQFAGQSLESYVSSDRVEKNWMTRFLSNALQDELTDKHLAVAKKVLEEKCLVGLMKYKWESLRRFETYFGWLLDGEKVEDCHTKLLDWNWPNKNKHSPVREGSDLWRKFSNVNDMDMKLYRHAEKIYKLQGKRLFGVF